MESFTKTLPILYSEKTSFMLGCKWRQVKTKSLSDLRGSSVMRGYEDYKYSFDKEGVLTYQHFIFKDRMKPAAVNLSTSLCDTGICIQVWQWEYKKNHIIFNALTFDTVTLSWAVVWIMVRCGRLIYSMLFFARWGGLMYSLQCRNINATSSAVSRPLCTCAHAYTWLQEAIVCD